MVRINLLPDRRQAGIRMGSAEPEQLWFLGGIGGAIVLAIIACLFVQKVKQDDLAAILAENLRTQGTIDGVKQQISDHSTIQARLKELREREDAILKLQSARTGPTATLLELAHVLTPGRGPTADRDKLAQLIHDNPAEAYNPSWDPRRVWLTLYTETERVVRLAGMARDGEDVSEFERRLKLSDFFTDVRLLPGDKVMDSATHQELFHFELSAKVKY